MRRRIKKKKEIIVAVSGGFDPVHIGHIELFKRAKKLGDKLVVILNNDNWIKLKKKCVFMPQSDRKKIIESIRYVDEVIITKHKKGTKDISVCSELKSLKPDIYANGGDRFKSNIPEVGVCNEMGIRMVFNVGKGGKLRSSSAFLRNYVKKVRPH